MTNAALVVDISLAELRSAAIMSEDATETLSGVVVVIEFVLFIVDGLTSC